MAAKRIIKDILQIIVVFLFLMGFLWSLLLGARWLSNMDEECAAKGGHLSRDWVCVQVIK